MVSISLETSRWFNSIFRCDDNFNDACLESSEMCFLLVYRSRGSIDLVYGWVRCWKDGKYQESDSVFGVRGCIEAQRLNFGEFLFVTHQSTLLNFHLFLPQFQGPSPALIIVSINTSLSVTQRTVHDDVKWLMVNFFHSVYCKQFSFLSSLICKSNKIKTIPSPKITILRALARHLR